MTTSSLTPSLLDQDWKQIVKWGSICAVTLIIISLVGMPIKLDTKTIINPLLSLGYISLFWVPLTFGYLASSHVVLEGVETPKSGLRDLMTGACTGAIGGAGLTVLMLGIENFDIRDPLINWGPQLYEVLSFGARGLGSGVWIGVGAALGLVGAALNVIPAVVRRGISYGIFVVLAAAVFEPALDDMSEGFHLEWLIELIFEKRGGLSLWSAVILASVVGVIATVTKGKLKTAVANYRVQETKQKKQTSVILFVVVAALGIILPIFMGTYVNSLLANVGIFLLLALGLNIVVGLAGILDLGYVAFFAVGAYTTAVLTSPDSPFFSPELNWALALLIVIALAALTGLIIGAPVIRMRGDYLAIVTLGFGEIIRLLFMSDFLKPYFGGAQGILSVPGINLGFVHISGTDPKAIFYLVLIFCGLAVYVSWRLQASRLGRSWMAIREDEQVAEAMGINTVNSKLMAFVVGAVLASFAGAIMAARVGSVFPNSFMILISIVILVVVIVGGMGSIPGVFVGAFVLIGVLGGPRQPGLLQEFGQLKLLVYGALLVYMMLKRPEGLVPSARRTQELHQEEFLQDSWLSGQDDEDEEQQLAEGEEAQL
ncbi:MAG TPA: branched-chain amino acid ABC transporter permease [Acidimicrobiales bacterium]|nr:branched-chain amino acid ABC transporter permease [Acidimicrobiales bacterium]